MSTESSLPASRQAGRFSRFGRAASLVFLGIFVSGCVTTLDADGYRDQCDRVEFIRDRSLLQLIAFDETHPCREIAIERIIALCNDEDYCS